VEVTARGFGQSKAAGSEVVHDDKCGSGDSRTKRT